MISWSEITLRLFLAAVFGGLVGIERQRREYAAGFRTHMMVCVGAALAIIVSAFGFKDVLGTPNVVLDPSRIAAQVISGIGFLGAGAILFFRQQVIKGLTTAAGLWTVAAIGLASGAGLFFAAFLTTVIALIILSLLKPLENFIFKNRKYHTIRLVAKDNTGVLDVINKTFLSEKAEIVDIDIDKNDNLFTIDIKFNATNKPDTIISIINSLGALGDVKEITWNKTV